MEFVTVFFPLLEVYKNNRDQKVTSAAITEWEKGRHVTRSLRSVPPTKGSTEDTESQRKSDMYNMPALERALEFNARELLDFAATKQFTGENIIFLTRVRAWKERWNRTALAKSPLSPKTRSKLYEAGKEIFDRNISLHTSQFPVNLESKIYYDLEAIFGSRTSSSSNAIISPFADLWGMAGRSDDKVGFEDITRMDDLSTGPDAFDETHEVPHSFNITVFDRAERSIKYTVFTNTWSRYLDATVPPHTSSSWTF